MGPGERTPPHGFEEVFTDPHFYSLVCRRCGYRLDFVRDHADLEAIRREYILHLLHHRRQDRGRLSDRGDLAE
jgi:C4-type Zn-finger protein